MSSSEDANSILESIGNSQGLIQFEMDGTIIEANENFLSIMGYTASEIEGKHHSMFADAEFAKTPAYEEFWVNLRSGNF
ncbi:MAG TPA: PAS domain S-box protein, partial [Rhodospirillales bacterium]|nr:PAS domain S-box protein [Rhodospirillales bacterium]